MEVRNVPPATRLRGRRWVKMNGGPMKNVLAPAVAILLVAMTVGTVGANGPIEPTSAADPIRYAGVPGPYTGPDEVPAELAEQGWRSWGNDEFTQCGKLKLVFLNPDLQTQDDNKVHAQGTFFIQFQAVDTTGEAIEVTRFSFSFGKTHDVLDDNPTLNCNESLPENPMGQGTAGAYLMFYRSDFSSEDGFFVPIETRNVPDEEYAAAVHAYTGDSIVGYTEVARGWTRAVVDNCVGQSLPNSCPNDSSEDSLAKDRTMPWPIVLPGDGIQTNDVAGLTVEFPEAMNAETVRAWVGGQEVPLSEWTPPPRDVDLVPLNDEDPCPAQVRSVCETKIYGPGFQWIGNIPDGSIIRVEGADVAGNLVTKQMHLGSGVLGGTVALQNPEIDFEVRGPDTKVVNAGDSHPFEMRLKNIGGADAHVNLMLEYNKTFMNAKWETVENIHSHEGTTGETHVQIAPGEQTDFVVRVTSTAETPKGTYPVRAVLEYPVAGEMIVKTRDLFMTVDSVVTLEEYEALQNTTEDKPKIEESPGLGIPLVAVGIIGALAVMVRRRS